MTTITVAIITTAVTLLTLFIHKWLEMTDTPNQNPPTTPPPQP